MLHTDVVASGNRVGFLNKMSPEALECLAMSMSLELSRAGVEHGIDLPNGVEIGRRIPVTDNLTEVSFIEQFERHVADALLARVRLDTDVDSIRHRVISSSPPAPDTEPPTPAGPPASRNGL